LGVVDETGTYLPPHTVFPLLLQHLTENRRLKGAVVQAVSLGYVSERLARAKGLPWGEVPVGFKHVADVMGKKRVLLGGEESGGYGVGLWTPERDGVLMGLLLMELVTAAGRPLSVLVRELAAAHGASSFQRADTPLRAPVADKNLWTEAVSKRVPEKFAGRVVKERRTLDGLKVVFDDASWVLLRPSGTEPLLRVYAETPDSARTAQLVAKAQEWAAVRA
jgi:phosphomannomutase